MLADTIPGGEADATAVDLETISALRGAEDRDELFVALLRGAFRHLDHLQLLLLRGDELRGFLALDADGFDDQWVRQRHLPLKLLSVACRTTREAIPYLGPLPETDPLAALLPAEGAGAWGLGPWGIAIFPLRLGQRPVGVLLGHPRQRPDRWLRDSLSQLASETALALARLLEERRQRSTAPATSAPTSEVLPSAEDDDWLPMTKPAPIDAGAGRRPVRRHQSTLVVTPVPRLAVAITEDSQPVTAATPDPTTPTSTPPVFLLTQKKPPSEPTATLAPARERTVEADAERRTAARHGLRVEVHHRSATAFFTGFMEDISEGGLFVATYSPLAIGDRLELTFTVPGFIDECTTSAEVRWIRPAGSGSDATLPGMGLRFLGLPEAMRRAIRRFVETLGGARKTPGK